MKVLVTGGLGFIGSHTSVELQQAGHEVVIIDDCSNASETVLDGITAITGIRPEFVRMDLRDKAAVSAFFEKHPDLGGVIHFAASKAVGESVEKPLLYYENNLCSLVYLLKELTALPAARFIFSSSCTVYGQADSLPITESAPVKPAESPYGNTKQVGEEIIRDTCSAYTGLQAISLRYFFSNARHCLSVFAFCPIFIVSTLGARFGSQTSYQFCELNAVLGTPRGGRRTVPIRRPSPATRSLPSLNTRNVMDISLKCRGSFFRMLTTIRGSEPARMPERA